MKLILAFLLIISFEGMSISIIRDDCLTKLKQTYGSQGQIVISPSKTKVLHKKHFREDSVKLYIFPICDTANRQEIITFYNRHSKVEFSVVFNEFYPPETFYPDEVTIMISLRGTTENTHEDSMGYECFIISFSDITTGQASANKTVLQKISANNYPNPFNPITTIDYHIPISGFVSINIYNLQGELMRVLVQQNKLSGSHRVNWDGRDNRGKRLSSGQYFYQIVSGDYITTKRSILLK